MLKAFDVLQERGFFYQHTHEDEAKKKLNEESVTFYVGFDPTADSLHIGHLLPVMAMRWLQLGGHRPLALIGGSTAMIGDPTGRTTSRPMMTQEQVNHNVEGIRKQLAKFLDFSDQPNGAVMVNNYDWLAGLSYIEMLRDIGTCFSVNRMVKMESVKMRMEQEEGISFMEFNYMVLQAYDFLHLNRVMGCSFQFGGQDQWGNILAGIELTRRKSGAEAFGATFPLLLKSNGEKFGKSAGGAVWLDPQKTSPFDYYQFWRNVDDADVRRLLCFFTTLPMADIETIMASGNINRAKEILAFEATQFVHGLEEATKAYVAAGQSFGFADIANSFSTSSKIHEISENTISAALPTLEIAEGEIGEGIRVVQLMVQANLTASIGEARRLITGGGAYVNDERIADPNQVLTREDLEKVPVIRAGKKKKVRIVIA